MKRTKIVGTIGPASEKQATLQKMIRAGMNVARLNMSHGSYAWHTRIIRRVRAAAKEAREPVAVFIDLQGPKARLGEVSGVKCQVSGGEKVVFTTARKGLSLRHKDSPLRVPIVMPNFHKYVKKGSHLLIADGTIECVVEKVVGRDIQAKVTLGGELKSHKGIAIQGVSLPLPALTAKDKKDAAFASRQDIDFVALSFVKQAEDVRVLRRLLTTPNPSSKRRVSESVSSPARGEVRRDGSTQIIVKIETREAVHNFEEILKVADGVMIARGDLALATSPEEVPLIQKELIEKCRRAAKPVIVATEMLASMEKNPRPTRAEASDVANAVIDHTDATMLSGESAIGAYPVKSVEMMARIAKRTEKSRFDNFSIGGEVRHGSGEEETALLASVLARQGNACAIIAGSLSGHTGRLLSRYRTETLLLVGSPSMRVARQMNLSWGILPFQMPEFKRTDGLLAALFIAAHRRGVKKGNKVVFIASKKLAPHAQSFVGFRVL